MSDTVRIVFGGDVSPRDGIEADRLFQHGRLWSSRLGERLAEADLIAVNLETVLGEKAQPRPKIGVHLRADRRLGDIIAASGIKLGTLANNHIFDYGAEGVGETTDCLRGAGVEYLGVGETPEAASRLKIVEVKGRKIGFLAYAEHEFNYWSAHDPSTALLDPAGNVLEIQAAAKQCDFLVVFSHFGPEGHDTPSPRMKHVLHSFVRAGASAIINCHAHRIMGMEFFDGVPICYGLGNLFFPGRGIRFPWWYHGVMAELTIEADGRVNCRNIFTKFDDGGSVDCVDDSDEAAREFEQLSAAIADDAEVEARWLAFCRSQRKHLLRQVVKGSMALFCGWLGAKLCLRKRGWQNDRSLAARGTRMFRGLLMCENHVEEFQWIFDDLMKNGW